MVPLNVYFDIEQLPQGTKLLILLTGMIAWTAEWVAKVAKEVNPKQPDAWTTERVMMEARENAMQVLHVPEMNAPVQTAA